MWGILSVIGIATASAAKHLMDMNDAENEKMKGQGDRETKTTGQWFRTGQNLCKHWVFVEWAYSGYWRAEESEGLWVHGGGSMDYLF